MTNRSGTLYVGVTNNLRRRVREHRERRSGTFTGRYRLDRVVYVEVTDEPRTAIAREKQLKGWTRRKKIALINAVNPRWCDLVEEPEVAAAPA